MIQVLDVSTSKTGKHGHAKCHFVGQDIFTLRKMEELVPSSHNLEVPHVSRRDYTLLNITDDGFCSLMEDSGATKEDLKLPNDDVLARQIQSEFDSGKNLVVTVLISMGEEMINAVKEGAQ